ncbi:exodeoxyribonuclease I [Gilvimarinus sp. DA14]|uniref:exodeoxyribonuclease I n=1 Tax=Gilvimarinus sp. DA14 TaxID=2956798 RepID=UPI0020B7EFDB|nr:exodeoxyribonuclease I [Gilvimarinus sp. DA14]UTF60041.1 exodeoxyribonuclease I [Gilvimarinus sp. DA14]
MAAGGFSFYWHDYETWGEVPAIDRPSQFAGVRTDADLNVIGEPLMIYCKPPQDLLPKPAACLVTGLSPQLAQERGLCEAEFMAQIAAELGAPGTCGVGYNSIRFDDEVTRYNLYRNFYDPYEREWKNGNSRWDLIDVMRMARALRPEGITWPNYEDGTPCFKLEALTAANNLEHGSAHDALSDVYATIALARLLKTAQPKLFEYALKLRNKRFAAGQLDVDGLKPVLHISSRFPSAQGNAALVVPLAWHPQNKNSVIAFNLSSDPQALLNLASEALAERLFVATSELPEGVERLALKEIHLNKSPMVLPLTALDEATAARLGLDRNLCERHWQTFYNLSVAELAELRKKLADLYQLGQFAPRTDPEQMLYEGFFSDHDRALMRKIRNSSPEALGGEFDFHDGRLPELLFRYRARNFPHTLTPDEAERWRRFCYRRLTDPAAGASLVKSDFDRLMAELLQGGEVTPSQRQLLEEVTAFANHQLAVAGG